MSAAARKRKSKAASLDPMVKRGKGLAQTALNEDANNSNPSTPRLTGSPFNDHLAQQRSEQKKAAVIQSKLLHSPESSSEYHIRSMELKDCAACFHLGEKVFTSQFPNLYRLWDEYEVVDALSSDNNKCFVAETLDHKLVGFIFGDEIKKKNSWRYGYVHWIAIDPLYRRRGIGTELYNRISPLMMENDGVRMILCDTPSDNHVARRFFEKLGFADPISHVYMSRNLSQQAESTPEPVSQPPQTNNSSVNGTGGLRRSRRRTGASESGHESNGVDANELRKKRKANVVVREMIIDDLHEVYVLGESVFGDKSSPNLFRFWEPAEVLDLFETDSEFCFVAEIDEQIVGFCLGTTIKKKRSAWKYGYLIWLGISPQHQGQGIGATLYEHFQEVAVADGARMIFIDTQADSPAVQFWEKRGFGHSQGHVFLSKRINIPDAAIANQTTNGTALAFGSHPHHSHHNSHLGMTEETSEEPKSELETLETGNNPIGSPPPFKPVVSRKHAASAVITSRRSSASSTGSNTSASKRKGTSNKVSKQTTITTRQLRSSSK